jgi:hypothetical protein
MRTLPAPESEGERAGGAMTTEHAAHQSKSPSREQLSVGTTLSAKGKLFRLEKSDLSLGVWETEGWN